MVLAPYLRKFWPLIPALGIYSYLAYSLQFIQDDAYISYRYVANFLNGDGLVYNIGERIEGFTNFGWTVYMILLGALGADFVLLSRITGYLFGGGVIWLTFLLARSLFEEVDFWFVVVATMLVGINLSLAYWSPAGLETAAFAFFALWSFYLFLKRSWLLIFALVMAVWIRPEGAVITGILIIIETIQHRSLPRFTLACAAMALVLSLPFVVFKVIYYGSIFPNPFYAKTSLTLDQLSNGWEYTARFLKHYALYYVGCFSLVVPVVVYRRLTAGARALWIFTLAYLMYIILVGGDVLKVHRFFLPLFGPVALLMLLAIYQLIRRFKTREQHMILIPTVLVMLGLSYSLPKPFVERYNSSEKAFTEKMQFKARQMKQSDPRDFSVALATIGIFGYELLGHEIIDMVGLTDSTIARYSEDPIEGMETTWKEQKHNSRYLLERAPDYIMFSTGIKPSAPAERALLLYRQFMDSYRTVGWYYARPGAPRGVISSVFKRVRPIEGEIVPVYPVEYVQEYKKALDAHTVGDHVTAIRHYDRAARVSPQPYFVYLVYQKAFSLQMLGQHEKARRMLNALVAQDSTVFEAHMDLYRFAVFTGDSTKAAIHKEWLIRLVPWYWPRIDSTVMEVMNRKR